MLTHYYISEEWMLSTRARQVYRLSAFGTLALFVGLLALILVGPLPAAATPAAKFIIFVGAVAMATVWTAMEYFLFGFDRSSAWKKVLWFAVMLVPFWGAPLYCLTVYSRATAPAGESQQAKRASA